MYWFFLPLFLLVDNVPPPVQPGLEVFFSEKQHLEFADKRIGADHQSHWSRPPDALERQSVQTFDIWPPYFLRSMESKDSIMHGNRSPIVSKERSLFIVLHGETRRPKPDMLKGLDVLVYDIQCTGVRAYTYPTTLFYMMEEAAKTGIEVIVLDRPNPINGLIVDGPDAGRRVAFFYRLRQCSLLSWDDHRGVGPIF